MNRIFDWLMLALIVAIVFLMVRPGSQGPALVTASSSGVAGVIKGVTGGGSW